MTRQWLSVDAMFYASPLALRLHDEFGWAGPAVWLAFLGACKRNSPAGQMTFVSDADALAQMGLTGRPLVDDDGKEWDLDMFWTLLGRTKNVRRTSRGRVVNVRATHWERWQQDERREDARDRKRRSRDLNPRDTSVTRPRHVTKNVTADSDSDNDIDPPPPSSVVTTAQADPAEPTSGRRRRRQPSATNGNGHGHPPGQLVAATIAVLARHQLDTAQADATAGHRPPVHRARAWLTAAETELADTVGPAIETLAETEQITDPEQLATAWELRAPTTAGPATHGPPEVTRCPHCTALTFDCRCDQ